jgi:hypothetical protein
MHPLRLFATVSLASLAAVPAVAQISQASLIQVVETHKASVLRYIDAAPDSMLGFRPTKGVRNFAEQIEHAAGSDALIAHLAITGSDKVPALGDSAVYLHNKAALRAYAIAAMDHTIQMLKGVTDAQMDHFPWTLGQTVPYLRLNGVTPPAYSPF